MDGVCENVVEVRPPFVCPQSSTCVVAIAPSESQQQFLLVSIKHVCMCMVCTSIIIHVCNNVGKSVYIVYQCLATIMFVGRLSLDMHKLIIPYPPENKPPPPFSAVDRGGGLFLNMRNAPREPYFL